MSDPVRFLNSLGQTLAAMLLYSSKHPARERAVEASYEQLDLLSKLDPKPQFSFLDGEVIYRRQVLRDFKEWEWGIRLAKIGVQRVEFLAPVELTDYAAFLAEIVQRLSLGFSDTSEVRYSRPTNIRFGLIAVRGSGTDAAAGALATATIAYTLHEEVEAIGWVHERVETAGQLPRLEAEAIVRSLSLAMHSESQIVLPLLQLKTFDQYTATHSSNVAVLSMGLAEYLGLDSAEVRRLGVAGLLHDLGKVRIPKEILLKPGAFTDEEREVMRRHPAEGARIILEREAALDLAAVVAYEHHIMLNGDGYPPLPFRRECHYASKLVHVCDVYDALCTHRPYREAWESQKALAYLEENSGSEFDPEIVIGFTHMMRKWTRQEVAVENPAVSLPSAPPA